MRGYALTDFVRKHKRFYAGTENGLLESRVQGSAPKTCSAEEAVHHVSVILIGKR
jgi:hypothetical protein